MNKPLAIALLALVPLLASCADNDTSGNSTSTSSAGAGTAADANSKPSTILGHSVEKAMTEAREKMVSENIELGNINVNGNGNGVSITTDDNSGGRPKAELTPGGDLLIDGRKIAATPEQHALLQRYRKQVEAIALAGMDIGVAGADLGMKAAGEALMGVFTGNTEDIEKKVEAEAKKIEASALKLCDNLPPLFEIQTQLAAAMPEFKPYANMEQADIDDCKKDNGNIASEIRKDVSDGIREAVNDTGESVAQAASASTDTGNDVDVDTDNGMNTAAEAEAASAEGTSKR